MIFLNTTIIIRLLIYNLILTLKLLINNFKVRFFYEMTSLISCINIFCLSGNPLLCNCESQDIWKWMREHLKIILKGSDNLRCEHPEELHGQIFISLPSQKLCDLPIIVKVAIQDIQTYSVIVSWQSRNQTGLTGFQIAYFGEHSKSLVSLHHDICNVNCTKIFNLNSVLNLSTFNKIF